MPGNAETGGPAAAYTRRASIRYRRWSVVVAASAVIGAGVIVVCGERTPLGLGGVPAAGAQPAPTGPTGGSGDGGLGGPPFPMQPPGMPDGPGAYNSGSYPAPDQGNGISIYNSGGPQGSGTSGGYPQGPNYPQQLQPANGTQPPDYDAPLQTPQPQSVPQRPAQNQPNNQQPQQNPSQQQPTTVTVTVTASSEPVTAPPSPSASAPPDNNSGSQNAGQEQSEVNHEGNDDRSNQCPGNVSPLYANNNVDPKETNPITIKDIRPFITRSQINSVMLGGKELTFHFADGTPDGIAKAFRDAAKLWNDVQHRVNVHEVGPQSWFDFVGPSLTVKVLDSPPPAGDNGGKSPAQQEGDTITVWQHGFDGYSSEQLTGAMAHEIGHALGLAHSCKGSLMYYNLDMWQASSPTPLDVKVFNDNPQR